MIILKDLMKQLVDNLNKKLIAAKEPKDNNMSPYGIDQDWFMDTTKLNSYQIHTEPISSWMPQLIRDIK